MIVGNIQEIDSDFIHYPEHVRKALDFLRAQDFSKMADGRYPIEGEHSFALLQRYTTRPVEECRPEAHRKYVDIQYLVEGEECLGWCPVSPDLVVSEAYDGQKDVEFYQKLVPDSSIVLSQGLFAVLFPLDVHRPCVSLNDQKPSAVTKVVVKIEVDLV